MKMKICAVLMLWSTIVLTSGCKKTDAGPNDNANTHTKKYPADVATAWYRLLTEVSRITPYPPPPTTRLFAYTGLALYESVLPGMPSYKSIYTHFTGLALPHDKAKEYHWPSAANAALSRIASRLLANYGPPPHLSMIQALEDSFQQVYAVGVAPDKLQLSIDFGRMVADKVYDWSTLDGTLNATGQPAPCPAYTPVGGPGNWIPTPPGFFAAAGACQGQLRTFVPNIVQTTRPMPPPAYSTAPASDFYKMADKIYQLSLTRSANDSMISEAWRDRLGMNFNTPAHVLRLTTQIIDKENSDLEKAAVIFSQQGMAMFDAIAASFGAKFHYSILRPITYIRDVMGKPGWNSIYPTPQHPSYPAVAPAAAAAGILVLEKVYGTQYAFADSTQHKFYGTWNYSAFSQLLTDVGKSRTHSGLNFEIAITEGIKQGRAAGEGTYQLPFRK